MLTFPNVISMYELVYGEKWKLFVGRPKREHEENDLFYIEKKKLKASRQSC